MHILLSVLFLTFLPACGAAKHQGITTSDKKAIEAPKPVEEAQPQSPAIFQDLEDLRVEVNSIQLIENGASVSLNYFNKTKDTLYLVIPHQGNTISYSSVYLTDDQGNEYQLEKLSGISTLYQIRYDRKAPLIIRPGSSQTVSFLFRSNRQIKKMGSIFSIAVENGYVAIDENSEFRTDDLGFLIPSSVFNISMTLSKG